MGKRAILGGETQQKVPSIFLTPFCLDFIIMEESSKKNNEVNTTESENESLEGTQELFPQSLTFNQSQDSIDPLKLLDGGHPLASLSQGESAKRPVRLNKYGSYIELSQDFMFNHSQ